ncbi:MAG: TraR/DksA family transcriptional regulator [Streptosporangiaceae bacterium]
MAATAAIAGGPWWRSVLEARWRDRLHEVTELSLAFHDAAAAVPERQLAQPESAVRQLMDQAITARRALADTDEALARLATGSFGRCESCAAVIPLPALRRLPEERYCPPCAGAAVPVGAGRG